MNFIKNTTINICVIIIHMPDKKLTPEQIDKIQAILKKYREETDKILEEYYSKVKQILAEQDAKKMEELKQLISKNT